HQAVEEVLLLLGLGRHVVLGAIDVELLDQVRVAVGGDGQARVARRLVERRQEHERARLAAQVDRERAEVAVLEIAAHEPRRRGNRALPSHAMASSSSLSMSSSASSRRLWRPTTLGSSPPPAVTFTTARSEMRMIEPA